MSVLIQKQNTSRWQYPPGSMCWMSFVWGHIPSTCNILHTVIQGTPMRAEIFLVLLWGLLCLYVSFPGRNEQLLHTAESFLRSYYSLRWQIKSPPVIEPEGSLPCLKKPATGPYPEPDARRPQFPPFLPNIHSNITIPTTPRFSTFSSIQVSQPKHCIQFSYLPCVLHAQPI